MIQIQLATPSHVDGIIRVCSEANWATYREIYHKDYLEVIINKWYNPEQILKEVSSSTRDWGGYIVALDQGKVIGAGGGGMISSNAGEIFVLYLDPNRRNEGIGTLLLSAITRQQKQYNATEQWVSVLKGNDKGIPFYEAKGFKLKGEEVSDGYSALRYCRQI